jgi:hypothetical protein
MDVVANRRPSAHDPTATAGNCLPAASTITDTTTKQTDAPCKATAAVDDRGEAVAKLSSSDHNRMALPVNHSAAMHDDSAAHS